MNCRELEPLIYMVGDGELTEKEMALVTEHLAQCQRCRQITESVKQMTGIVSQLDYAGKTADPERNVIRPLLKAIENSSSHQGFGLIRYLAAAFLLVLVSVFIYQEFVFQNSRNDLQNSLRQTAVKTGEALPSTDCVERLRRKFGTGTISLMTLRNPWIHTRADEEELVQYIRRICDSDETDPARLKKLLRQSGIIGTDANDKIEN